MIHLIGLKAMVTMVLNTDRGISKTLPFGQFYPSYAVLEYVRRRLWAVGITYETYEWFLPFEELER